MASGHPQDGRLKAPGGGAMEPMRLAELAGITSSVEARSTWRALDPRAPEDYRQLAALLLDRWYDQGVQYVGIGGGQGAGKSTLGRLLVQAGELSGLSTCVLSIDDFYLPRADRLALAQEVHPLLATRGPPGTHDIALCHSVLDTLPHFREVTVPVFDKGRDDRTGRRTVTGYVDVVVLEGWCVGARPSPPELLAKPVNSLEREQDPESTWRKHINDALGTAYAELFEGLDSLVYLQAPDMAAVRRWRLQQEQERPPELRMTAADVDRFVQHYDRVTLAMMRDLPYRADTVVALDQYHKVAKVAFR